MASGIGAKQQRRKRYSEAGVVFTEAYVARVSSLPGDASDDDDVDVGAAASASESARAFKRALRAFTRLGSTFAEVEALRALVDALVLLANGWRATKSARRDRRAGTSSSSSIAVDADDDDDAELEPDAAFAPGVATFLALIFLENSRPLHRYVITSLRRFPPRARAVAEEALGSEILAAVAEARERGSDPDDRNRGGGGGGGARMLRCATALASVNGCQPQTGMEQRVLRRGAVPIAALVAEGASSRRPSAARFFSTRSYFSAEPRGDGDGDGERGGGSIEHDEHSFQKLELPSQARTFGAMEPGPLGAVANGF